MSICTSGEIKYRGSQFLRLGTANEPVSFWRKLGRSKKFWDVERGGRSVSVPGGVGDA